MICHLWGIERSEFHSLFARRNRRRRLGVPAARREVGHGLLVPSAGGPLRRIRFRPTDFRSTASAIRAVRSAARATPWPLALSTISGASIPASSASRRAKPSRWIRSSGILLQLTWEALEDAGIRPSSIAGTDVGVFVGASQADYGHNFFGDHAVADSHFATGTALAILANRISYIYDLRGPSLTVDTACSSSLVALHQAVEALRSGRIDTAIVGGINVIASPASFIAFSQASMLSPTGLCQAFSAKADGFVRAEGGVVLVLRKAAHAHRQPQSGARPRPGDRRQFRRPHQRHLAAVGRSAGGAARSASTRAPASIPTGSPSSRRMAPARRPAIRSKPQRLAAASASSARRRCRSARSRPTSAISSRLPALPAC